MSNSFKRNPYYKYSSPKFRRFAKKEANKSVRRYKGFIPNGKTFRKIYNPYAIYDIITYCDLNTFNKNLESTEKEVINNIFKYSNPRGFNSVNKQKELVTWDKMYKRK